MSGVCQFVSVDVTKYPDQSSAGEGEGLFGARSHSPLRKVKAGIQGRDLKVKSRKKQNAETEAMDSKPSCYSTQYYL